MGCSPVDRGQPMSAPRPMGDHEAILRDWRRSVRVWEAVADGDGMVTEHEAGLNLLEAGARLVTALAEHGCHR
jgi:hypothetical protein